MSKADVARRIGPLLADLIDAELERQERTRAGSASRPGASPEPLVGARGELEEGIHA